MSLMKLVWGGFGDGMLDSNVYKIWIWVFSAKYLNCEELYILYDSLKLRLWFFFICVIYKLILFIYGRILLFLYCFFLGVVDWVLLILKLLILILLFGNG